MKKKLLVPDNVSNTIRNSQEMNITDRITNSLPNDNRIAMLTGKRLTDIESFNENLETYNNCCNFSSNEFSNANPYDVTTKEGRAWNLGYVNKPLSSDLKGFESNHKAGNIQRIVDLTAGALQIAESLVDAYGNIIEIKDDVTDTEEEKKEAERKQKEKEEKDAKRLKVIVIVSISAVVLVIGGLLYKKYRK
jgi:hypothetical protein